MSKTGLLTRSRSKRARPTESTANVQDQANPPKTFSLDVRRDPAPHRELARTLHPEEIVIGLALGSPGQSPLPPLPSDDRVVNGSHDVSAAYQSEDTLGASGVITGTGAKGHDKRKGSKWKTLGNLFCRKDSAARVPEASPFYQLDRTPDHGCSVRNNVETNPLRRKRADSSRSKTGTESSQSTTKGDGNGLLRRNSSRRKGLRRRKVEEMKPEMMRLHNALSAHAEIEELQPSNLTQRPPKASLLQVEIPSIELERYSVMFGDVLESRSKPKPQDTKNQSLLSRRQGHVENLQPYSCPRESHRPFTEDLLEPPHKRGDSASSKSSKSPSFSLFPSSSSTPRQSANSVVVKPLRKPSPLSRSTTAPVTLPPPSRPHVHKSKSQDQDHVFVVVHNKADLPLTPVANSGRYSSDLTPRSANSTQASSFECPEFPGYSYSTPETTCRIEATSKGAREAFIERAFPTRKSSIKKSPGPLVPRRPGHSRSNSASAAAEISIARQISISRRQQQLLVPIAPKLARQPRQPTLVNGISTPAARKSHHLTLEDA